VDYIQDYPDATKSFVVGEDVERWSVQVPNQSTIQRVMVVPSQKSPLIYEYRNPGTTSFSAESLDARTAVVTAQPFKTRQELYVWAYAILDTYHKKEFAADFTVNGWTDTKSYIGKSINLIVPVGTTASMTFSGRCTNEDHQIGRDGVWRKTLRLNGKSESAVANVLAEQLNSNVALKEQATAETNTSEYLVVIPRQYGNG